MQNVVDVAKESREISINSTYSTTWSDLKTWNKLGTVSVASKDFESC